MVRYNTWSHHRQHFSAYKSIHHLCILEQQSPVCHQHLMAIYHNIAFLEPAAEIKTKIYIRSFSKLHHFPETHGDHL